MRIKGMYRDHTDWHTGNHDPMKWLQRLKEKRDDAPGFESGHCVHGHGMDNGKGHGQHDHWNNGQWRHACNTAPEFVEMQSQMLGDTGVGGSVMQVHATDVDPFDTLVYSLAAEDGGEAADAEFFEIDPETGEITLAQAVSPSGSADGDGVYEIVVEVTDGTETVSMDLDITFVFGG